MSEEQAETTLRDTIEQAFEEHTPESQVAVETPPASKVAEAPVETEEVKAGRTAGRERDEKGRLLPGAAKKEPTPEPATATPVQQPQAATPAPAVARPSSWKKDYEPKWATLDPDLQKYILERESQFAKGVSAYKTEWDQAKPLVEAMQPFMPELQKAGIHPGQWISNLGNAHKTLATGAPEQKLAMFLKLAQDYQVPVQQLFTQRDGQVYYNPQVQAYQPPVPQQAFSPEMIEQTVQSVILKERSAQEVEAMKNDPVNYPHFETLREDMALAIESGFAADFKSAYETALSLPKHRELFNAQAEQQRAKEEAERKAKLAADAQRARQASVSPRSATPTVKAGTDKKGLRAQLEDAFNEHAPASRV